MTDREIISQTRSAIRALDLSRQRRGICVSAATVTYEQHLRLLVRLWDEHVEMERKLACRRAASCRACTAGGDARCSLFDPKYSGHMCQDPTDHRNHLPEGTTFPLNAWEWVPTCGAWEASP